MYCGPYVGCAGKTCEVSGENSPEDFPGVDCEANFVLQTAKYLLQWQRTATKIKVRKCKLEALHSRMHLSFILCNNCDLFNFSFRTLKNQAWF